MGLKERIGEKFYLLNEEGKRTFNKFELVSVDEKSGVQLKDPKTGRTLRVHESRVVQSEDEAASIVAESKPKPKPQPKVVEKKEVKGPSPFDLKAFVAGREHWENPGRKFDHTNYKVSSHAVIDEKDSKYYAFNVYRYPNGVVSLGKNGTGIAPYPLLGGKVSYTVSQSAKKVESRGEKRVLKGTRNVEQIRESLKKKGYKQKPI